MAEHDNFISVIEAASRLCCHPSTVSYHARKGRVRAEKRMGRVWVHAEDVETLRQAREPQPYPTDRQPVDRAAG